MTAVVGMHVPARMPDVPDAETCLNCTLPDCDPDSPRCPIYGQAVVDQMARNLRVEQMQRALRACRA